MTCSLRSDSVSVVRFKIAAAAVTIGEAARKPAFAALMPLDCDPDLPEGEAPQRCGTSY